MTEYALILAGVLLALFVPYSSDYSVAALLAHAIVQRWQAISWLLSVL